MANDIDREIDNFLKKLSERFEAVDEECEYEDCFNEFVKDSIEGGMKDKEYNTIHVMHAEKAGYN